MKIANFVLCAKYVVALATCDPIKKITQIFWFPEGILLSLLVGTMKRLFFLLVIQTILTAVFSTVYVIKVHKMTEFFIKEGISNLENPK